MNVGLFNNVPNGNLKGLWRDNEFLFLSLSFDKALQEKYSAEKKTTTNKKKKNDKKPPNHKWGHYISKIKQMSRYALTTFFDLGNKISITWLKWM